MAEDDEDGEEEEEAGDHEAPAEQREAGGLRLLLSVAVSRRGLEVGEKPPASALSPAPPLLSSPPALTNSFITSGTYPHINFPSPCSPKQCRAET